MKFLLNHSGGPGYGAAFLDQEATMELYNTIISKISDILYYPLVVPLFLVFTGVYFTIRSRGIQIRLFGEMFKVVSEKPKDKDGVSSFAALMVSTASRVGTGNIIGVSTALCLEYTPISSRPLPRQVLSSRMLRKTQRSSQKNECTISFWARRTPSVPIVN